MSELVDQLTSQTGISPEQVHDGLGALFSFLKKELGDELFGKLKTSVPDAGPITDRYEESPEPAPHSHGSLFEMVSGLAGKLLGGKAGAAAELLATLSKLGYKPEQIESFLPRALELVKSYLSPELVERVLASVPALGNLLAPEAKEPV
jgi:hypothetical protein